MTLKTLALFTFLSAAALTTAGCLGDARSATHTPKTPPVVDAKVTGMDGVRAQFIVRRDRYTLDPRLRIADVLKRLRAMQHPVAVDFEPGARDISAQWFERLSKAMGITKDGRQTRSIDDIQKDPQAMKLLMEFGRWQQQRKADLTKAMKAYDAVFGPNTRREAPANAQAFDAVIRITNDGKTPLVFWDKSDMQKIHMRLTGPGAMTILAAEDGKAIFMMGVKHVVAPGASVDIPVKSLAFGNRRHQLAAYATKAGRYELQLEWLTSMERDGRRVKTTLTFPSVAFDVR